MPLWGATDADESKPKWLTTAQKKEVFANTTGWVVEAGSTQSGNGKKASEAIAAFFRQNPKYFAFSIACFNASTLDVCPQPEPIN